MPNTLHASTVQLAPTAPAQSAVGSQAEHLTLMFLLQLIVIFSVSRLIAWFSTRRLGQTPVAGEILAGLVLGPSLLGYFFLSNWPRCSYRKRPLPSWSLHKSALSC